MLPLALHPGDSKGKGQQMNVTRTVALCDHSNGFVSVTCCICTDNMLAHRHYSGPGTANSGMETTHNPQGTRNLLLSLETHGGKDD